MMEVPPPLPVRSGPPPLPEEPAATNGRYYLVALVGVLYAGSLILPAIHLKGEPSWPGWHVLLMGWMGMLIGQFAWLANLLLALWLPLVLTRQRWAAFATALLALVVALHCFTFFNAEIPMDEAGVRKATMLGYGPALWLWLGALVCGAAGTLLLRPGQRPGAGLS